MTPRARQYNSHALSSVCTLPPRSWTKILALLVHVLERPFCKIERTVWLALQEKADVPGSLERAVATAVTRNQ